MVKSLNPTLGQTPAHYQGGEYSNHGQDYEDDNGEQDGDEDADWMNRKSVIKFEDVDDENEDEEREVGDIRSISILIFGKPQLVGRPKNNFQYTLCWSEFRKGIWTSNVEESVRINLCSKALNKDKYLICSLFEYQC